MRKNGKTCHTKKEVLVLWQGPLPGDERAKKSTIGSLVRHDHQKKVRSTFLLASKQRAPKMNCFYHQLLGHNKKYGLPLKGTVLLMVMMIVMVMMMMLCVSSITRSSDIGWWGREDKEGDGPHVILSSFLAKRFRIIIIIIITIIILIITTIKIIIITIIIIFASCLQWNNGSVIGKEIASCLSGELYRRI